MQSNYSIQLIEGKGLGVVATDDISKGDIIISESPLVATPLRPSSDCSLCEMCMQPVEKSDYACRLDCGVKFCCQTCYEASGQAHLCIHTSSSMRMLQSHMLYRKAARFRLYCKAVAQASAQYAKSDKHGNNFMKIIDGFMHHPLSDSLKISTEFRRQCEPAIELLCDALQIIENSAQPLQKFASASGYQQFWCICAANAQEIVYTHRNSNTDGLITAVHGMAIFPTLRRLNHTCIAVNSSVVCLDSEVAGVGPGVFGSVAVAPIRRGEEIFINYLPSRDHIHYTDTFNMSEPAIENGARSEGGAGAGATRLLQHTQITAAARPNCRGNELLERYGFECRCSVDR